MPAKKSTRIEAVGVTVEDVQGTIERIVREGARKPFQAALAATVTRTAAKTRAPEMPSNTRGTGREALRCWVGIGLGFAVFGSVAGTS
jgi:hypothetical protein